MTTNEIAEYYAQLLVLQYVQKPKAFATVKALVLPVIMDQVPLAVQDGYAIQTAVGVQLDVLGKYVGASRNGYANGGSVVLGDDDFRILIQLVLIKNNSGSSLYDIQTLLAANFPGFIRVSDNQNMGLNYVIKDSLGTPDLLEIIVNGGYLPSPMGVAVSATIIPDITNPFFGFVTYEAPSDPTVAPFNTYELYQTVWPWLTYEE